MLYLEQLRKHIGDIWSRWQTKHVLFHLNSPIVYGHCKTLGTCSHGDHTTIILSSSSKGLDKWGSLYIGLVNQKVIEKYVCLL